MPSAIVLTAKQERDCLSYDPFFGDETQVTPLRDVFVKARKAHRCQNCSGRIRKGQRVRAKTERNEEDRKMATFYWCPSCCRAMAISDDDAGDELTRRNALGDVRRGTMDRETFERVFNKKHQN